MTNTAEAIQFNEDFEAMLEKSFGGEQLQEGSIVEGEVISVENDFITVDVGLKSEGRIAAKEFTEFGEKQELNIGDKVEVYVERLEGRTGEIILSREKAISEHAWDKMEAKMNAKTPVNGMIFGQVKGGFTVDLGGIIAFLPGSQVDVRPIKDVAELAFVKDQFLVLKMDKKRGNVIVSRRAIMEESRNESRDEMLKDIVLNQVMDGIVKNLTNYGAFIDLGGIDGLLHVTDISWQRINHPSEILKVGDKIKVQVIKYDDETKRVSLGIKQMQDSPWKDIEGKFKSGQVVKGKVTSIADYGVFVDIGEGIEGLIHLNELSWVKKNQTPSKVLNIGDEIDVKILEVETDKNRISISYKQTQESPWDGFATSNKVGDEIEGEIKSISDFGFFVGLEGGIDGLAHYSDLSWTESGEEALKAYSKGQTVKAKILSIDVEKERIGLGIKQLDATGAPKGASLKSSAPTDAASGDIGKNQVITCVVEDVKIDGIEVSLPSESKGASVRVFIKKLDLSKDRSEQRPNRFAIGDRVDAKVISVGRNGQPNLSIKALEIEEHNRAIKEYGTSDSGASLGDILGAALQEKKAKKPKKETK
jgi:small subunit ribosomal protein S1